MKTFIGGKARNMHKGKRAERITKTGMKDKTAVMGILESGGKVRTSVIPNRKKKAIQAEIHKHVEAGSALYTDALLSYEGLAVEVAHSVVDHAVQYVDGKIHTNGLENFWSLLKRGMERMFRLNLIICSATWTNRRSATTTGRTNLVNRLTMRIALTSRCVKLWEGA